MGTKPRIALTLPRPDSDGKRAARKRYIDALESAGADVIPLYPGDSLPASFDGLCLSGGEDVDPARYGAAPDPRLGVVDPERDATEFAILSKALESDVPVLGICRGFQVLNVAFGGPLIQHIDGHEAEARARHEVVPRPNTLLARISGDAPLVVNSRHHQAVSDAELAHDLRACSYVDGLVEGLESAKHRFVLGVQWHPERSLEVDAPARRVFDAFVTAARELVPTR